MLTRSSCDPLECKLQVTEINTMDQTPSVPEPAPDTYVPTEIPPMEVPPGPDQQPEIDEPPLEEPIIPIREPGRRMPASAVAREE